MDFFKTLFKNFSWATSSSLAVRGSSILKTILVARIIGLGPTEFGLFGIATLILGLSEIATEVGTRTFLLQEKHSSNQFINTAWMISLLRGTLMFVIIYSSASLIANLFHAPGSLNLIRLISIVPLLRGFINPSCINFQKHLQFDLDFFYRAGILFVELVFTAIFCLYLKNAYGLILGFIVSAGFEAILSFIIFKPLPKFSIQKSQALLMLSRGKHITASGIFDYLYTNGDNFIVALLLNNTALGLYQNAYRLATLTASETNDIFYKVSFPTFVDVIHDKNFLSAIYPKYLRLLIFLLFLQGLLIIILARPLVLLLLGPNWLSAVTLVQILGLMSIFKTISYSFNSLFTALKKQKFITLITFAGMSTMLIAIVPFIKLFGLYGAAWASMLGSFATFPVALVLYTKVRTRHE